MSIVSFLKTVVAFNLGLLVNSAIQIYVDDSPFNRVRNALEVCERDLPRTQKCVIKGVPEDAATTNLQSKK